MWQLLRVFSHNNDIYLKYMYKRYNNNNYILLFRKILKILRIVHIQPTPTRVYVGRLVFYKYKNET